MHLYRVCKEEEYDKIMSNNSDIGKNMITNNKLNTHNYASSIKYLHFFTKESDIIYLRHLKNRYLCTYNIPDEITNKHIGYGYYLDCLNFRRLETILEYAIPSNNISIANIEKIELITSEIDIEDYMYEEKQFKKEIYNRIKTKKLVNN